MSRFARLIEKDIMTDVPLDEAGDSEIIDLTEADKFSCQAIYVVDTPVGASVTFRCSNDLTTWTDIQAATAISADGSVMLNQPNIDYRYFKAVKALDSGTVDLKCLILVTGDAL